MAVLRTALVLGVAMVVLAMLIRPRFPDSASNHTLKTITWTYMHVITIAQHVGGLFGYSKINITRAIFDVQLLMDKVDAKRATVEEYTTIMDGVEVLIFKPVGRSEGLRPGIIQYHGGGWALMTPDHYGPLSRAIAEKTDSVIVSVNYRLAPENLFPIPIEDCLRATRYFLKNAEKYGVDPNRVGVKGESAGRNLAMAAALQLRQPIRCKVTSSEQIKLLPISGDSAGGNLAMAAALQLAKEADPELPKLKFMSLDYPALQAFDFDLPVYRKYENGPGFLQKYLMITYWLLYGFGHLDYYDQFYTNNHTSSDLKAKYGDYLSWDYLPDDFKEGYTRDSAADNKGNKELSDKIEHVLLDPLFAPLMAPDEDLSLLPPSYIMNAEFDCLRDDGMIAAERLRQVGVQVEYSYLPAEEHGFLNLVEADDVAKAEVDNFAKFFDQIMN